MADIITGTVSGFVNNIPNDTLNALNDLRVQSGEETCSVESAVKDARYDIGTRIADGTTIGTNLQTQYYISAQNNAVTSARDLATLTALTQANTDRMSAELAMGVAASAAATALAGEKTAAAVALAGEKSAAAAALGQALISKDIALSQAVMTAQITGESQKTRELINELQYSNLNRSLIERNAELVEERHERRHYRDRGDMFQSQGQWAAVQSQLQAFQSQLQTATQGTVNFGTMSGNAGRNTSTNNVA